jgi:hypothetical protein
MPTISHGVAVLRTFLLVENLAIGDTIDGLIEKSSIHDRLFHNISLFIARIGTKIGEYPET